MIHHGTNMTSNDEFLFPTVLQKAILELISELNTPEALKIYFSLLAVDDAPVKLLISRMEQLCNQQQICPFSCVNYPIYSTEPASAASTCDTFIHRSIQSYRDIHSSYNIFTPFTEASQIIPLNFLDLKLWNSDGFSLSTWIEMKKSCEDNCALHVVSLGTDKLLLAVYLNSDGSFEFNVMKPNQNLNHCHDKLKINKLLIDNAGASKNSDQCDKENVNKTNIFGLATAILKDRERPNIRTRSSLRRDIGKSLSTDDDSSRRMETSKVSVKSKKYKLKCDRWYQVCLSVRNFESQISVLLTLNGTDHENIEIPIDGMMESDVNGMLQLLFIGSQKFSNNILERTMNYSLSNVLLFKAPLETYLITYLYLLGPDCDNFIDCEIKHIMPLRGFLNFKKVMSKTSLNGSLLSRLQSNIFLSYSVGNTNYATAFLGSKNEHGKALDIFTIGKVPKASNFDSISRAVYYCGGLSSLLFLFARVVELTEDASTQSSALYILLKMAFSNNYLYAEFEQKKLFNLVAHIFKHSKCYRGPGMLKAFLDVIYGGSMFLKKSQTDDYRINEKSELNIQNPSLLLTLLTHFNIFHTTSTGIGTEAHNIDLLFKSLKVVVKESHPYKHINRQCLTDYGFYEKIIEFCKTHLANTVNSMSVKSSTALLIIDLLKMLSKDPPTIWSMNEIQKLLMLLHHPSESFITHDRSKFCFILPSQRRSKFSRSNNSLGSRYFNFSTKIRASACATLSISPSNSQRSSIGNDSSSSTPPKSPQILTALEISSLFNETETKLSKAAVIRPSVVKNFKLKSFDQLTEHQILKMTRTLKEMNRGNEFITPSKNKIKRLQNTPKQSPFPKSSTPIKRHKRKYYENEARNDEADQLMNDTFETFETLMSSNYPHSSLPDVHKDHKRYETGISVLQENLFLMLQKSIIALDDTRLQDKLPDCFKIESLIMFANHFDPNVRAAIIDLIHIVSKRQSADVISAYQKANYWIHLGNQLSISPINGRMLQAIIDWISADKVNISEISSVQQLRIKYMPAFRILIAMLPSMTHDSLLLIGSSRLIRLVIETQPECFQMLIENALIVSCVKALIRIPEETDCEPIQLILEQIAIKSLSTMGLMYALWELLASLTYAQRQNKSAKIRDIHMQILKQLLSLCLIERARADGRSNSSSTQPQMTLTKVLGNLPSSSEIKTRFNLISERAIQYILTWENIDELNNNEIYFVKYMIELYFLGVQQGSTLILWSLNPLCNDEIKYFTAQKIITMLLDDVNFSVPESKILKSLLAQLVNANALAFSEEQLKMVTKFCGTLMSHSQQNWNWSMTAIEKIETMRKNAVRDRLQQVDKVIYKAETLVQTCIDHAMRMTREVIDMQNKERRKLMNQLKRAQEMDFYHEWRELIQRMVHENAPWFKEELFPNTFELDETEGPSRVRIRLKRTILKVEKRFFLDEFQYKANYQHNKQLLDYLLYPKETERYSINDQIVFTFNGKHLTMDKEIDGEIIITDNQLVFLATHYTYTNSIICNIPDVDEVCNRRYQHKEIAMEIFLKCSNNFFIIFESNYERDIVNKFVSDKIGMKSIQRVEEVTQKWTENNMTNFEYLMELNKISGRSFNDLMQYPVFPWVLANYNEDCLDLTASDSFRRLEKTISTQYEANEEHYVTNYRYLLDQMNEQPQSILKPYHYSSHYSNSGTVLHFLVRLPPFTNMFLLYQGIN